VTLSLSSTLSRLSSAHSLSFRSNFAFFEESTKTASFGDGILVTLCWTLRCTSRLGWVKVFRDFSPKHNSHLTLSSALIWALDWRWLLRPFWVFSNLSHPCTVQGNCLVPSSYCSFFFLLLVAFLSSLSSSYSIFLFSALAAFLSASSTFFSAAVFFLLLVGFSCSNNLFVWEQHTITEVWQWPTVKDGWEVANIHPVYNLRVNR